MSENADQTQAPQDNSSSQDQSAQPVTDYGEILARQQHELARTGKTVESLRSELNKSHDVLGRVQKAFTGEKEEKLSPYQQRMREFDELSRYIEEETKGGLPITSKIGKQLAAYGKESEARAEKLESELAELKAAMKRQQNPAYQGLERAAFIMEGMVDEGLEQLYGADKSSKGIRAAQFNALTARINDEIKDLMQNDPEALLKVQRNPKIMRRMVNQFMAEMLPPKVRTMMDNERLQNEVMPVQELYQAFSQAKEQYEEAQRRGDAKAESEYSNVMTEIRHEILSHQISSKRGGTPDKPTLNSLFGQMLGGRS